MSESKNKKTEVSLMNSEMHFLPAIYSQDHHQLQQAEERFIGRPFGYGFGGPFLGGLAGGLVAGSLLSPYGYGGYGYGGYPYGGYGGYGYG
ncbi:hypothetical protein P4664_26935, partial [Priestia megaterium]|nr:hypothetical protein [Priestia megaterium]